MLLTDSVELEYYEEALQVEDKVKWELAMDDEMESLMKNQAWGLIELPKSKRVLHNKWVYRLKEENDCTKIDNVRMVVKDLQREGIDFNEIFSHIVKLTIIRSILSIVATKDFWMLKLRFSMAISRKTPI